MVITVISRGNRKDPNATAFREALREGRWSSESDELSANDRARARAGKAMAVELRANSDVIGAYKGF